MSNTFPICEHCGTRHKQCEPSTVEKEGLEYIEAPAPNQINPEEEKEQNNVTQENTL